jgi:hypothetical protein
MVSLTLSSYMGISLVDDSEAITACIQPEVNIVYLRNKSIEYTTQSSTRELRGGDKCGDNSPLDRKTPWKTLGITQA